MSLVRCHGGLFDAWDVAKGKGSSNSSSTASLAVTPESAVATHGVTCDSPLNTYSTGKKLDPISRKNYGKRLDYIFYRQPYFTNASAGPRLTCSRTDVVFTDLVPGRTMSYSDHFGLEATLRIVAPFEDIERNTRASDAPVSMTAEMCVDVIRILTACYRVSTQRSRIELGGFALGSFALLMLCVGSAWLPHAWINPIFVLVTIALSWYATTMLYVGFIYGNWERRALTSVIEEIEMFKHQNCKPSNVNSSPIQMPRPLA